MNEFLDWLKEECLPGIWSRGVALSRNSKSIERITTSKDLNELKFKIQTTERILAFQVTLWLKDQDAHCNCGSKIEPCHHIVGVALGLQNGVVPEESAGPPPEGAHLQYHWIYHPSEAGKKAKITLKRNLIVKGEPQTLQGSLVALIGGIQSGRIKLPLPSVTPEDLKIDELFATGNPPWREVLRACANLPDLPVEGHPTIQTLKANPKTQTPVARILDSGAHDIALHFESVNADEILEGGLFLSQDQLMIGNAQPQTAHRTILKSEIPKFVRLELQAIKNDFEMRVETTRLPELIEGLPTLVLHPEALSHELLSLTARIEYPMLPEGQIFNRNLKRENELIKEARQNYNLAIDQPQKLGVRDAILMRDSLSGSTSIAVDRFISNFLQSQGDIKLEDALKEKELLLKLLEKREKQPAQESRISALLQNLAPGAALDPAEFNEETTPELWNLLRDYQKSGVRWLKEKARSLQGAILADDMGLGKTIQTLAVLESKSLVLLPTSLLQNWKEEAHRFRPDLKVQVFHGTERTWDEEADLTLSTYSILRQEPDRFSKVNWSSVVLDEAHLIRNPETQAAIAVTKLRAHFRIALTGTPIQNKRRDLLSLFQFVSPGLFTHESEMTAKLTSPFFLRRTKSEVLKELPPKTYLDHVLPLNEDERRLYQSIYAAAKTEILKRLTDQKEITPFTFFEVLLRARQVCNHPGLIDPDRRNLSSSKLSETLELIEELVDAGHSVLVYSQWTQYLNLLENALEGIAPVERLDGTTQNRGAVVTRFQNSDASTVFLLSLQAGGVGLNLTKASHVIFCDPWWNPYAELQAEDRAYRMGQEKPVTIHRMLMEGTIEMDIRALQKEKLKLGDEVFKSAELETLIK
jgi:hypothetical protein